MDTESLLDLARRNAAMSDNLRGDMAVFLGYEVGKGEPRPTPIEPPLSELRLLLQETKAALEDATKSFADLRQRVAGGNVEPTPKVDYSRINLNVNPSSVWQSQDKGVTKGITETRSGY